MKQDEHSVVKEAQAHVRRELRTHSRVRPGVFMLVRSNPQTGAPLSQPAAIGQVVEQAMEGDTRATWFADIRAEANRLQAVAVAVALDAEAETEDGERVHMAIVCIQDAEGVEVLVAPIEHADLGARAGNFGALDDPDPAAAVGVPPLMGE